MILNWLLKRPIMCLTCSSAKFLSNRPFPFTDYRISEFGCLKRKNRCQAISNFNEKEVWKKPKQTTDMKHSKIRHSEIKKKWKTTISTFLCFTQSNQKKTSIKSLQSTSPGILAWLDVIPQCLYQLLFHLIKKTKLFSVPPNVQQPNCPAEIFVLRFYAFGPWNNAENQWDCLESCTGPALILAWQCGYCWWVFMVTAGGLWIHCLRTARKYFPAPSLHSSSLFFPINIRWDSCVEVTAFPKERFHHEKGLCGFWTACNDISWACRQGFK